MGQDAQGAPPAWGIAQIRAAMAAAGQDTLVNRMGITLVEATATRVVGTMPVAGNTQPAGLLHGGASCVLAETLGSVGAALHAGPGKITVGTDINATHHRAATSGEVTAVATQLHGGRTTASYEIVISDDRGRRVCTARLSCLFRDPPGAPGDGTGAPGTPADTPGDQPGTAGDGQATGRRTDD